MSRMPASLRPWSAELSGFSDDIMELLAPWLGRIDKSLRQGRLSASSQSGDIDGYDGIDRIGSFDRLMISDWLLMQDYPDEFLRRFTDRELSYYQYAHVHPSRPTQIVVLFDTGPDQIGLPRLAHIALFVVFARRAMLAGCEYRWGVLQDHSTTLYEDTGPDAIVRMLQFRSAECVDDATLQRWLATLDTSADVWHVSNEHTHDSGSQVLGVTQLPGTDPQSLLLQLPGGVGRLQLNCPSSEVCVSVLRNPYAVSHNLSAAADIESCRFTADARRLIVTSAGRVQIFSVAAKPSEKRPTSLIVTYPENELLIGVQSTKKKLFVLTATSQHLRLRSRSNSTVFNLPANWDGYSGSVIPATRACWATRTVLYFVDGDNVLWRLAHARAGVQPDEIMRDVVATFMVDGALRLWVAGGENLIEYRIHQPGSKPVNHCECKWPDEIDSTAVLHGETSIHVTRDKNNQSCVGIFGDGGCYFQVGGARQMHYRNVPDGVNWQAIFTLQDGLWVLGTDNFHHDLIGFHLRSGQSRLILSSPREIDAIWTSIREPRVACKTGAGAGFVADLSTDEVLLEFGEE